MLHGVQPYGTAVSGSTVLFDGGRVKSGQKRSGQDLRRRIHIRIPIEYGLGDRAVPAVREAAVTLPYSVLRRGEERGRDITVSCTTLILA